MVYDKMQTMKLFRLKDVKKHSVSTPLFTDEVKRQSPLEDEKDADVSVDYIEFPKGVRNEFHTHTTDQVLIMTKGSGIVANREEELHVVAGDVVFIPAGEDHWHGADNKSSFTHISVTKAGSKIIQTE